MISIKTSEVDELIQKVIDNLLNDLRVINGDSGWHQFLGSEKIGNVATAQGIILFRDLGQQLTDKQKCIDLLVRRQLNDIGNLKDYGGWPYVTNLSDFSNTDSTCWALLALDSELEIGSNVIQSGLSWLIKNHNDSSRDEGWGMVRGDISRVHTTCLVLKTLRFFRHEKSDEYRRGISWLKSIRNVDNGWGDKLGAPSTIVHTSKVVIVLSENGYLSTSPEIAGAINFIENAVRESINSLDTINNAVEIFDIQNLNSVDVPNRRIIFNHLVLAYVVLALIKSEKSNSELLIRCVQEIIEKNNHGYWYHNSLPSKKPMWAIFNSVEALQSFRSKVPNWRNVNRIKVDKGKLIYTQSDFTFFSIQNGIRFFKSWWGKALVLTTVGIVGLLINNMNLSKTPQFLLGYVAAIGIEILGYYITEFRNKK